MSSGGSEVAGAHAAANEIRSRPIRITSVLSVSCAVIALTIGTLALIGWIAGVEPLRAFVPGRPPMQVLTALMVISAAITVLILRPSPLSRGRRLVGRAWALLVVVSCTLVILEYALGRNLGVDLNLPGSTPQPIQLPGRPALTTASGLFLVGLALLLLDSNRLQRLVDVLLFCVAMLSLFGAISHLFHASALYQARGGYPLYISLNASIAFLLLCGAITAARPDRGWMALLRSDALGGLIARPLVLGALLVPPLFGLLILFGERAGLYDIGGAFTLLVTSFGGAGLLVVSIAAEYVNRDVSARKEAERALRVREAQLDAFFDATPSGLALLDRDLRYLKINEALAALNGPSVEEHLGRRIQDVLKPIGETLAPLFEHIRDTGEPLLNREVIGATPRDPHEERYWIVSYFPVFGADHHVAFLGAAVHEISDLKRAQQLAANQARDLRIYADQISDLYNHAPCGYHSLGPSGEYLQVNNTELGWLGYVRSEVLGRPITDFLTDESRRVFGERFPHFREIGAEHDMRFDFVRKGGSVLPVLVNSTAIKGADGTYLLSRSTMIDYTEQQRLQDELKDALRSRDEFLSIASHDLKSPLTSLLIQLDRVGSIVERSPVKDGNRLVPDSISGAVTLAHRQVERMQGLVDDLLDLTRIRAGRLALERTPFDLVQATGEVIASLSPELERLGIQLTLHAAAPVRGCWDRRRIEQVLANLITNAIKYGKQMPIDVFVDEMDCGDSSRRARVRVVDSGIGIPSSQRQIVFERFERASDVDRQIKGLGLGLYIARRIIDAHGGTIGVESNPSEGSTFSFTLPIVDGD